MAGKQHLNPRMLKFIDEYVRLYQSGETEDRSRVGTQAAINAGYAPKGAHVQASRLLKNAKVKEAIDAKLKEISEKVVEQAAVDRTWVLSQSVRLYNRCMEDYEPVTERVDGKYEQIVNESGTPLFEFDAAGAARALKMVGDHVDVQAFKQIVGVTDGEGEDVPITETAAAAKIASLLATAEKRQQAEQE